MDLFSKPSEKVLEILNFKSPVLISACLLGIPCYYHGKSGKVPSLVEQLIGKVVFVPVCPEQLGGLPTPRPYPDFVNGRIFYGEKDVTFNFQRGSMLAAKIAKINKCKVAILKLKSPCCDFRWGFLGKELKKMGVKVFGA